MSEKTTLLPSAPADPRFADGLAQVPPEQAAHTALPMPRLVIVPGLEFDASRKYRYGVHAIGSAILILVAFVLVEIRDCNVGPGIDLDRLQALHISIMVFATVLYMLSLFGIADFIFQFKIMFLVGVLIVYVFTGLMIWMTYEAVTNPCAKTFNTIPIDLTSGSSKNVFGRGDGVGIVVLLLDIFATLLMFSAATNFYQRY